MQRWFRRRVVEVGSARRGAARAHTGQLRTQEDMVLLTAWQKGLRIMVHFLRNAVLAVSALCVFASAGTGAIYHYDASVTPDDPSMQAIWSTGVQDGTSWSVSNGELTMRTAYLAGLWFGNHEVPPYDVVPWSLANDSEGNFAQIRAKLGPNSSEWNFYIRDGQYESGFYLLSGGAQLTTAEGPVSMTLDMQVYHTYAMQLYNGLATYWIDGSPIFGGAASPMPDHRLLIIGDASGGAPTGYGTFILNDALVITHVPEPATLALLGLGTLALLRRRRWGN